MADKGAAQGPAIDATRVPRLASPEAQAMLKPFLGRPIDSALLADLRAAVGAYYKRIGLSFVATTVPRQDVTDGVLQLVVTEGRLGEIAVEGAHRQDRYLGQLHVKPGEPIDSARLQADIDWINRHAYRHASVVAAPGERFGETNLVLKVEEQRPFSVNGAVENTGNQSTGLERLSAGFDWGDAFGRGDDLNYLFQASKDFHTVRQHSLNYTADLPWRHSLSLSLSYATTRTEDSAGDVGTTGVTKIAAVRYAIPLRTQGPLSQHLAAGFDFKSTNNDILFGGQSVFPTVSEVNQFLLEYGGQASDRFGGESFTLTLVGSPGGLTAHNTDAAFQAQQVGALATYVYARLSATRTTTLPKRFAWTAHLTAEFASANLLPSEQLGFGGFASVRGFVEQAASRDNGAVWQNELGPGPLALDPIARALRLPRGSVAVAPFLFLDAAAGRNHHDPEGALNSSVTLVSAGPGLSFQVSRYISGRLTWGSQLHRSGSVGARLPVQFSVRAVI